MEICRHDQEFILKSVCMRIKSGYHVVKIEEYIPSQALRIGTNYVHLVGVNPELIRYEGLGLISIKEAILQYIEAVGAKLIPKYTDKDYGDEDSEFFEQTQIPVKSKFGLIDATFHVRINRGVLIIDKASISGVIGDE